MQPDDPSQIFVAKAIRVADHAIKRRNIPKTRAELKAADADIERRIKRCESPLGAFGRSLLGYAQYFSEQFGVDDGEAKLLAMALLELKCRER
jgi:hypothetical protein